VKFLPYQESGIARTTRNERLSQQRFVSVVNGVVRSVRNRDQELGIEGVFGFVPQIIDGQRVHVVNDDALMEIMAIYT
jgi:hypothetical protein